MNSIKANAKYYGLQMIALVVGCFFAPVFKLGLANDANLSIENMYLYRMSMVAGGFLIYCLMHPHLREELKSVWRDKKLFFTLFAMGMMRSTEMLLWSYAVVDSSTFVINILGNIGPLFVVIGSYLVYKEKTSWRAMVGITIAMGGVMSTGFSSGGMEGGATLINALLTIGSSLSYNIFLLTSKGVRQKISAPTMMTCVFLWTVPVMALLCIGTGAAMGPISPLGWLVIVATGLIGPVIGQTIPSFTIKYIKPMHISMINLLGPLVTAIVSFLMLGERLTVSVVVGGLIMIFGLALYIIVDDKDKQKAEALVLSEEGMITEEEEEVPCECEASTPTGK